MEQSQPNIQDSVSSSKPKIAPILGIVVLLILVACISYFLGKKSEIEQPEQTNPKTMMVSPTTSITTEVTPTESISNWHLYTADQGLVASGINFSFKYPQNWTIAKNVGSSSSVSWVIVSEKPVVNWNDRASFAPCVSVTGGLWPATIDLKQLFTDEDKTVSQEKPTDPILTHTPKKIFSETPVIVGGMKGLRRDIIRYDETDRSVEVNLIAPNAKGNGDVTVYEIRSCPGVNDEQFNQILSTFSIQ